MIIILIAILCATGGMLLNQRSETLMYESYHAKDSWHEYMIRKRSQRYHAIAITCMASAFIILLIGLINY